MDMGKLGVSFCPEGSRRGLVCDRNAFDGIREASRVLEKWKACKDIMRHGAARHFI